VYNLQKVYKKPSKKARRLLRLRPFAKQNDHCLTLLTVLELLYFIIFC